MTITVDQTLQKPATIIATGTNLSVEVTATILDLLEAILESCTNTNGTYQEKELLDTVMWLDDAVSIWDFTWAVYNRFRDMLVNSGELPKEEN